MTGKVQVLLSTYNGAQYIAEQLDSILKQTYTNIHILIRDDGSTDATLTILESYTQRYPEQITYLQAENVGVIRSFWSLIKEADTRAQYFCFCDQDDLWLPHKIADEVSALSSAIFDSPYQPHMICTATQITDENLNPQVIWPQNLRKEPSFYNALFQNIAVGTTIMLNYNAFKLFYDKEIDVNRIQMHDWWMYLTVSCLGKVYFDPKPSVYYRQHSNNVVGGESTQLQKIKKKWSSFHKHKNKKLLVQQAKEFQRIYGEQITDPQMKQQLEAFIAPRSTLMQRVRFLRQCQLYRQSTTEQLLFRFLILIGYI